MSKLLQRCRDKAHPYSWDLKDQPCLRDMEIAGILDLGRAWFSGERWQPPSDRLNVVWSYFEAHGLGGIYASLEHRGLAGVDGWAERAQERMVANMIMMERCRRAWHAIRDRTAQLDLPIVAIKGPVLNSYYGDDHVRSFSDFDLMVPSGEALFQIAEVMGVSIMLDHQQGDRRTRFAEEGRLHFYHEGIEIEMMSPVAQPASPRLALVSQIKDLLFDGRRGQGGFQAPDPTGHLLFLLVHTAGHFPHRLVWLLDLAVMLRAEATTLDWDRCRHELAKLQMTRMADQLLDFAECHLGVARPEGSRLAAGPISISTAYQQRIFRPHVVVHGRNMMDYFREDPWWRSYRLIRIIRTLISYHVITDWRPGLPMLAVDWQIEKGCAWFGNGPGWQVYRVAAWLVSRWLIRPVCRFIIRQEYLIEGQQTNRSKADESSN